MMTEPTSAHESIDNAEGSSTSVQATTGAPAVDVPKAIVGPTPVLPTVVIVGRPNVGKSTLFNRIVGEQLAIVEDRPGVTRDRKEVEAEWLGRPFLMVDTGGWLPSGSELDAKVSRQVEAAVRTADLVIFVVDAVAGLTEDDSSIAAWLPP